MSLNLSIPESFVLSTRQSSRQFEIEAKKAIAIKFYKDEKFSLGQGADFSGMTKYEFMKYLGENNISIFSIDEDELNADIINAKRFSNDQ